MATPGWHGLKWKLSNGGGDTGGRGEPESPKQNVMLREEEVAAYQDSEPLLTTHWEAGKKSRTHRFLSQRLGRQPLTTLPALWDQLFMG